MIEIRTLGHTSVSVDGEELTGEAAWPKSLALIVYMAREPGPDRRDEILGVLWPDKDEKRARRALNQLLYTLRKASPRLDLESVSDAIDFGTEVWLDVEVFEQRLKAGDLKGAVDLYHGPFLVDLPMDEPEMEHWADRQRADLRRQFRKAALQLAQEAKGGGDLDGAVGYCRRLLEADPLDDEVQHLLIECLHLIGNRLGALRQFERYREMLTEELDVEPLDRTLELVERIKSEAPHEEVDETEPIEELPWQASATGEDANSEEASPEAAGLEPVSASRSTEGAAKAAGDDIFSRRKLLIGGLAAVTVTAAAAAILVIGFSPRNDGVELAGSVDAATAAAGYAPASHAVVIAGDTTQIRYDPPTVVNLLRGDTVLWYLRQPGPFDEFEVDLEEHTPAYQRWIRVSATDTARAVIRLSANGGMYGYSITLRAGVRLFDIHPELQVQTRTNDE